MIAILVPTRGRPEQLKRMIDSAYKTCSNKDNIWVLCSTSEEEWAQYMPVALHSLHEHSKLLDCIHMPDMLPTAHKWNVLADAMVKSNGPNLFMLGADDMVFETEGWDKKLLEHYNALENKIHVYSLQDSRDKEGTPHPIVTREYIEALGYFCSPIFLHWQQDRWTVEIAKYNNVFTHLKDYNLLHLKPSDEGKPDETHTKIRSYGWRERDQWTADKCAHFLDVEKRRLAACLRG